jgi:N-acetylneuraminic acid mutarotase
MKPWIPRLIVIASLSTLSACGGGRGAGTNTLTPNSPPPTPNQWTWVSGSNLANQPGIYGSLGTPASSDVPGTRWAALGWTDARGNLWFFGGNGYGSTGTDDILNDLWEYSAGEWTWMGGSNLPNEPGVYGTQGVASASNVPGARFPGASWTDSSGNFWLLGGLGVVDTSGPAPWLNDLWKYSGGQWTWMGGSNLPNQPGVYGIQGVASSGNVPGARFASVSLTDASGNFWLFGGDGPALNVANEAFNDLWKYSAGQWTWMSGSNMANQAGTYGTQGMPASSNAPGARGESVGWTDLSGNFWLFGGSGLDSQGTVAFLNDLWKYSAGQWTWMSGPNVSNPVSVNGIYGTKGRPSASNIPGARYGSVGWTDASGNLWLFGGDGYDSTGNFGNLNDLWNYSAGQWTWISGANTVGQPGTYGAQGTASPINAPGARLSAVGWTDASGNFWLFGGGGYDSTGTSGYLNDLWKYEP